jgi:hypothetical protein
MIADMKHAALALLTTTLAGCGAVFAADTQAATMRCDPATVIKKIDGDDKQWYNAGHGQRFRECAIPLTPGPHTLEVCVDAGNTAWPVSLVAVCAENRRVTVDAQPGRIYRLRIALALARDQWNASIEDVTEAEAGLPYTETAKKPRSRGANKGLETIVVLRATPEYAFLGLQEGTAQGKWFQIGNAGTLKVINSKSHRAPDDGYHIVRVFAGDTFAMTWARVTTGSAYTATGIVPCGNFPVRVYEGIPGGKVLYLGHLVLTKAADEYVGEYHDDLAEARAYIDAHRPDLAGRLETAPFRELRASNICRGMGDDLVGSQRVAAPQSPAISPGGASAGSRS